MIPGDFLPVAPRPFEGELLSSWQGRIACRYDLCPDHLTERFGVARDDRSIGFSGRDFAPAPAAVSAWARACRLSEGRVREMALSTRPRPIGLYVWGEGRAVGAIRRPLSRVPGGRRRGRPRPSHSPDLGAGRTVPVRPAPAVPVGNLRALFECPGISVSEPRPLGPSGLYALPKRRARRRGRGRLGGNSTGLRDAVLRLRQGHRRLPVDGRRGAASRAAALGLASRAGPKQDPLHRARRVRRSLSAADRGGGGPERASGHGVPGVADGDPTRRRATPRSRRRAPRPGLRAVHA